MNQLSHIFQAPPSAAEAARNEIWTGTAEAMPIQSGFMDLTR
jgi:hypothetical protein